MSDDPLPTPRPDGVFERHLDLRGLNCPLPVLRLRKAVRSTVKGTRLRVEATDPLAAIDIPNYCREAGLAIIEHRKEEDVLVFVVEV